MPIANTYFDHFARYGYTLIVKLDNCRTNFETSINTNNHYISNSMFTLQGTLNFRISVGTLITVGMGIFQKNNKRRHPNYRRHGNFSKN